MDKYKSAVSFRQNGQNIFFGAGGNDLTHGTVVGKTHGGNYVVTTENGETKVVDSRTFEVVE